MAKEFNLIEQIASNLLKKILELDVLFFEVMRGSERFREAENDIEGEKRMKKSKKVHVVGRKKRNSGRERAR